MEGIGLKRSEVFVEYIYDQNPLISAVFDLVKQDPLQDEFLKTVHVTQLFGYARHKLNEDPETKHICKSFNHWSVEEVCKIVMHDESWKKYNTTLKQFLETEEWILDVLALFLRRRIILKPIFSKSPKTLPKASQTLIYQDQFKETYYIYGLRVGLMSFYVSAK